MLRKINIKNTKKHKRITFIILSILISLTSLIFIIQNFKDNIIFFYSPSEITDEIRNSNKIIKVGGLVKENTINKKINNNLSFIITDLKKDLVINYNKIPPDLFREGQGIIATGNFNQDRKIFIAHELLAKHDENYMPLEVKKSLEKSSQKYED